jgi:hypothetical protein
MYDSIQWGRDLARNNSVTRFDSSDSSFSENSRRFHGLRDFRPDRPGSTADASPAPFRFHPGPALPQEHRVTASGGRTYPCYSVDSVRHEYADFNQSCDRQNDHPEECERHYPPGLDDRFHLSNSYYRIINSFFGLESAAAPTAPHAARSAISGRSSSLSRESSRGNHECRFSIPRRVRPPAEVSGTA